MSMAEVPAEVAARIGQVESTKTSEVNRKEFQRYAAAVGDLNPLYFDADFARAHGRRDIVMTPMFLGSLMEDVTTRDMVREDGVVGNEGGVPAIGSRRLRAKSDIQFFAELHPGDVVTAVRRFVGAEPKSGRSGTFYLLTWETTYTNQDGVVVARFVDSMIDR